ncbi:MAG TPA: sodium ABC transporter ATP-binding protein [Firmicutes bacterium]|nr:sodium ABC transporter ATP-binding protein [Bacillota bacterium]
MGPILELRDVVKNFTGFKLNGISFTLEPGYIMGFIGANGSGKTTTIKLIMNLLHLDMGEIKVFGLDSRRHEQEVKQRIGFVYDDNHFYEELTIIQMTKVVAPFYKNWDWDTYNHYVHRFNLPEAKKIKTFSRGMKMKYALAVALAHKAELLIMDEPTSGLDPIVRSELLDILSEVIQDESCSILFSSHITSDLDRIADYVTLIHQGNIVFSTSKEELFERYSVIKGERSLLDSNLQPYLVGVRENQFGFEGLVVDRESVARLTGGKAVLERPTLEDIMLYCTREEEV